MYWLLLIILISPQFVFFVFAEINMTFFINKKNQLNNHASIGDIYKLTFTPRLSTPTHPIIETKVLIFFFLSFYRVKSGKGIISVYEQCLHRRFFLPDPRGAVLQQALQFSYVRSFACSLSRSNLSPYTFIKELGNLGTWKLGNLETWELGNLGTWELGNLGT